MSLALETEGLVKAFGSLRAVDGLDLRVEAGQTYGLLGPNGSGKTTTIKMLLGILKATAGTARLLGEEVPCRRLMSQVGYMPQESAIYMDNTVHENLLLFGEVYGLGKGEIAAREEELLKFVDLQEWRDSLVSNLSGGMRHRTSLACALIHRPRLLFLDEPTVGVDPELRATFWEYFARLGAEGTTVVITTHYMDEASRCSRVGLLRAGRLIAEGSPRQLKEETGTESLEDAFLVLARRGDGA